MKPDPDMMMLAMHNSSRALEAISKFQVRAGFAFGSDATHIGSYKHVKDLADELQSIGGKLQQALLDADERLTPRSRFHK